MTDTQTTSSKVQHTLLDAAKAESGESGVAELIVNELIKQRDKVIDILSTTATSRPKARKLNGGTKKRKPASQPATEAA